MATQSAAQAVQAYRNQLGMDILLVSNCRCSIPACDRCERRIGAFARNDAQYDPLKLMAIAEANGVTLKLTYGPPNHYVVCVLHRKGEPLIYDECALYD